MPDHITNKESALDSRSISEKHNKKKNIPSKMNKGKGTSQKSRQVVIIVAEPSTLC
jgi:hypothetical protein